MPGDHWQKLANLRAYLAYMWAHPGKQLLFMGSRVRRSTPSGARRAASTGGCSTTPTTAACSSCVADLNRVYQDTPGAVGSATTTRRGFEWIDADDSAGNTFSLLRWGARRRGAGLHRRTSPAARTRATASACRYGGTWDEVLNTDAEDYGGSGVGNLGAVQAEEVPWHGRPFSAAVRVPPLGALWLRPA